VSSVGVSKQIVQPKVAFRDVIIKTHGKGHKC
jgi:hypothetical protein